MNRKPHIYGETLSEEAPRPNGHIFEVLADHITQGANPNSETHDTLNDVYKALGNTELEASRALDLLEAKGKLRREDSLILLVLLAISRTLGPDLEFFRQALQTQNFNSKLINLQISNSGLQPNISGFLQNLIENLGQ